MKEEEGEVEQEEEEEEEGKVMTTINLCALRWASGLKWQTSWSKAN